MLCNPLLDYTAKIKCKKATSDKTEMTFSSNLTTNKLSANYIFVTLLPFQYLFR